MNVECCRRSVTLAHTPRFPPIFLEPRVHPADPTDPPGGGDDLSGALVPAHLLSDDAAYDLAEARAAAATSQV